MFDVELPIVVKNENIGALLMSQNASTGVLTWHVDTQYRDNAGCGIIKIEFRMSSDNECRSGDV